MKMWCKENESCRCTYVKKENIVTTRVNKNTIFAFDIIEFYNTCGILQAMFMYINYSFI